MKAFLSSLTLLSALLLASPAMAGIFGLWRVQGKLSGVAFVLDCHFIPEDPGIGGTCTGAPNGDPKYAGKVYKLKQGAAEGNQVSWSYPSHFMFLDFQVVYKGTLGGGQMSGTVTAAGRKGDFTATRE